MDVCKNFPHKFNYTEHKAKSKVNKNWAEKAGVARNWKKETDVTVGRMAKLLLNKNAKIYSYTHLSPEWEIS